MNKLTAILDLLRKGEVVANKEAWKTGQITVTALTGVILAAVNVAGSYGYALPVELDADTVNALAGATIGAVNIVMTYITSDSIGLLPAKA